MTRAYCNYNGDLCPITAMFDFLGDETEIIEEAETVHVIVNGQLTIADVADPSYLLRPN